MSSIPGQFAGLDPGETMYCQKIRLGFDYPVCFTTQVFAPENASLAAALSRKEANRRQRFCVVIDATMAGFWPGLLQAISGYVEYRHDQLELAAEPLLMPGGEGIKNDASAVPRLHARLNQIGMDRQASLVIVGGGAVQDVAGYAAATFHRGIRVVRLPTTVLAQADSALGVKNGVNAFGKKNLLGTFSPPFAVVLDFQFLETLSRRDTVAGMAEAVKVALIRDRGFFDWLEQHAEVLAACQPNHVRTLVQWSARLHLAHLATTDDPFELGSTRPLDFGHWAAHKLESLTGYRLRHGEAVAIGIALDTLYSVEIGLLSRQAGDVVLALLTRLGLPLWDEKLCAFQHDGTLAVLEGLAEFQEHLGGDLTITLLQGIGAGLEVQSIDRELMHRAVERLQRSAKD